MKTLIELYDERPIENVLGTEVFRPERTVFLCEAEVAQNRVLQEKLRGYILSRGLETELVFLESSFYNSNKVLRQLRRVVEEYPDCVLDITGGTDAALFAAGRLCGEREIPVFTYSRRRNCFFDIHNAAFAAGLPCEIQHTVDDCFRMAGGALRPGRVDNGVLSRYMDSVEPFFRVYLRFRRDWTRIVNYIQRASQVEKGQPIPLYVEAGLTVKGERGQPIQANIPALRALEEIGFLKSVKAEGGRVSFRFRDEQVRAWLRDVGSVLELYVYKACVDSGLFNDVRTSAVVDWQGDGRQDNVTNEIDVMAMQGILPAFLSCKTCDIGTEALNELAILRDRFGGQAARAAIVSTQSCRNITRHRAAELGIDVIDLEDLKSGRLGEHIRSMMRVGK